MLKKLYNYFKKHIATEVLTQGLDGVARYEVEYERIIFTAEFVKNSKDFFFSIMFNDIQYDYEKDKILHNIVLEYLGHDEYLSIEDPKKVKIWIDILKDQTKVDEMLQLIEACLEEEYDDDRSII